MNMNGADGKISEERPASPSRSTPVASRTHYALWRCERARARRYPRHAVARHGEWAHYETARATRADVRVTVTATGTLEAITTVEVGAEVTGRLLTVLVDANDTVKKGQLLAEIDPEQLRAAADEARAQVGSAEAAIRQAKATRVESEKAAIRAREQAKQGLMAEKDLEAAEAAAERAEASLASSVASATRSPATLIQALSRLDKTKIISPIDGIVLSRHVEPGQTVTAGFSTPLLFKLAQDLTQMRLNVDVDEADMGRVREGQDASFTVDAYPDRTFSSKVTSLRNEPKTSQNVVTYQGVLSVDNQQRLLRPGMTCTATILADMRKDVLVVPNAALRFAPPVSNAPGTVKEVGVQNKDASEETACLPARRQQAGPGLRACWRDRWLGDRESWAATSRSGRKSSWT